MVELAAAEGGLWQMGIAGDTLNTAWYARALLPEGWGVAYATVIGRDAFSERVPPFLAGAGIATDRVARHGSRAIGLYAISVTGGERSFSYWRDSSAARTLADDPARLARLIDGADLLHVSGITLAILPAEGRRTLFAAISTAREAGTRVSFDPNIRPKLWESAGAARAAIAEMAGLADIALPSFDDEAALFGDADTAATLARYAEAGAETVVVKDGGAAIEALHAGERLRLDGLARAVPVDTTGAGDSFNGALLAEVVAGRAIGPAVRRAHEVASRVVGHRGALMPFGTF